MSVTEAAALLIAIAAIITAISGAVVNVVVAIKSNEKLGRVEHTTREIHEAVNSNFTALEEKLAAALAELKKNTQRELDTSNAENDRLKEINNRL